MLRRRQRFLSILLFLSTEAGPGSILLGQVAPVLFSGSCSLNPLPGLHWLRRKKCRREENSITKNVWRPPFRLFDTSKLDVPSAGDSVCFYPKLPPASPLGRGFGRGTHLAVRGRWRRLVNLVSALYVLHPSEPLSVSPWPPLRRFLETSSPSTGGRGHPGGLISLPGTGGMAKL